MSLAINSLGFERNNQFLFRELHEALKPGEVLQIRGANGSGKSTLLRILAGYIEPTEGNVFFENEIIKEKCHELCYLGHQNGIKPYLTVYENLHLHCALFDKKIPRTKIISALEKMELTHVMQTQALHLSAGQSRRLALARLLLTAARLWILDEPTTSLDKPGQFVLNHLLEQHISQGGIIAIATHQDFSINHPIKIIDLSGVVNHAE